MTRYVALNKVTVNWCIVMWYAQNVHQKGSSFMLHQLYDNQTALLPL